MPFFTVIFAEYGLLFLYLFDIYNTDARIIVIHALPPQGLLQNRRYCAAVVRIRIPHHQKFCTLTRSRQSLYTVMSALRASFFEHLRRVPRSLASREKYPIPTVTNIQSARWRSQSRCGIFLLLYCMSRRRNGFLSRIRIAIA